MTKAMIPGLLGLVLVTHAGFAQRLINSHVPTVVKTALAQKYPTAVGVTWEKEKANYEANWGGRSGEDNSVVFTPAGDLVETVVAIPVPGLPAGVAAYVTRNYPGAKIKEAGKVTRADGRITYEAEVNKKDLVFDESGKFVRIDED